MTLRNITQIITGQPAVDGAGVRLRRVLGPDNVYDFDPFLMLDSFDSEDPSDYLAGFPMHPHRGIETITYLLEGSITHEDSLGNRGTIRGGECQWMTAGSGILHQEMPLESPRMLGIQLWLNLPSSEKMTDPSYLSITQKQIVTAQTASGPVKVLSGFFRGIHGMIPPHIRASLYDITLNPGRRLSLSTRETDTVFLFTLTGNCLTADHVIPEKSAVLFGSGSQIQLQAPSGHQTRILYASAPPLNEPIAWGGPIVMNTSDEIRSAFQELRTGQFIRHSAHIIQ